MADISAHSHWRLGRSGKDTEVTQAAESLKLAVRARFQLKRSALCSECLVRAAALLVHNTKPEASAPQPPL